MRKITIDYRSLPRGEYAVYVAENGHIPGVLSGAELRGKAKHYGAWYAKKRGETAAFLSQHYGVTDRLVLINSRWCRVWVDERGQPVRLIGAPS